jgi:DNA-binding transcriptional LysR family regulator
MDVASLSFSQSRKCRDADCTASQSLACLLNPLHVFEVASRVGSFTKAAELLSVTPSAMSRQISVLDSFLNVRLFSRGRNRNTLTEAGEIYYREIAPAFEMIGNAADRIKRGQDRTPLNVRAVDLRNAVSHPTLVPLPRCRARHQRADRHGLRPGGFRP